MTGSTPTCWRSLTVTTLIEFSSARRSVVGPWNFRSKFRGRPLDDLTAHPGVEADGRVVNDGGRRESAVERRGIDERLEGGAGLPLCLRGSVELAAFEIVAADEGLDGPVPRVQGDEGALQLRMLLEADVDRLALLVHRQHLDEDRAALPERLAGIGELGPLQAIEGNLPAVPTKLDLDRLRFDLEHGPRQDLAHPGGIGAHATAQALGLGRAVPVALVQVAEAADQRLLRGPVHLSG